MYVNADRFSMGFGGDLTYGKWVLTTTGLRGQISMQMARGVEGSLHPYYYGHVDIFFDVLTSLMGRNPSDRFRSYELLGVGIVHSSTGDNDFFGAVGLGCDWRIADDWRLYAELEGYIHPSDFDENSRSSLLAMLKIGATFDIANNPTRSRSRFETQRFANDWFFQIGAGAVSFGYRGIGGWKNRIQQLTPVFEFGMGKRLTTEWQIRLGVSGLYAKSSEELFSFYHVRGDLMLDIAGLVDRENPYKPFTARPYVSAGIVTRLDEASKFLFSPAGGIQLSWRPDHHNEVYLESRYVVTPPRFAHVPTAQAKLSVGIMTVMVGYSYIFSKSSFR